MVWRAGGSANRQGGMVIIGGEEAAPIALRKRGNPFCGACKKWGHTGPANVANSTRRGSEEGVNWKKITPGYV
jgi:hypothetical protein